MNKFLCMSIANRLKEKGFTFELPVTYDYDKGIYEHIIQPRISQVLDWLRTEKNIDIVIYPVDANAVLMCGQKYNVSVYNCGKRDYKIYNNKIDYHITWEDAALAGIKYILDNLL